MEENNPNVGNSQAYSMTTTEAHEKVLRGGMKGEEPIALNHGAA